MARVAKGEKMYIPCPECGEAFLIPVAREEEFIEHGMVKSNAPIAKYHRCRKQGSMERYL